MTSKLRKSSISLNAHQKAVRFGVIIGVSVGLLGLIFISSQVYLQDRIYPLVRIQGIPVGGMKLDQAYTKIRQSYPEDRLITFSLNSKQAAISSKQIQADVSVADALTQAYQVGRTKSWGKAITLESNVNVGKLQDELVKGLNFQSTKPEDASYQLAKGELTINPSIESTDLNIPLTNDILKNNLLVPGNTLAVRVAVTTAQPSVNTKVLETLKPIAQRFIEEKPSLVIDGKVFIPTTEQKLAFIKPSIVNGQAVVDVNEDNLKSYIDLVNKKVTVPAKPDIYYDNGDLSEQGQAGKALDTQVAFSQFKQALLSHSNTPVVLTASNIPQSKKVIDRPYEAGRFEGKYIEVDLSTQKLFQFEGTNLVGTHRVSTGKWKTPTPIGTFAVNTKYPRAYSSTYKLYMPYWMAFIGGEYGIHELPEWPDGHKEGEGHIGTPVSHGCIRLGVGEAQEVYDWAEIGTQVVIHQ